MASLEQLVTMGFSEDEAKTAVEAHGVGALDVLLGVASPAPHQASPTSIASFQYDIQNGRSSCTCICLEASLTVLERLGDGTAWAGSPDDVANWVNTGVAMYEAVAATGTLAVEHTSVAEILATVARYRDALQPATEKVTHQGLLGSDMSIARVLGEIRGERRDQSRPVAVVITKPPETVVCFLPAESQAGGGAAIGGGAATTGAPSTRQWLLFDSHPRPQHGLVGASVRSFGAEGAVVEALNDIFPAVDLGTDSVMSSMYNMFDCVPLSLKR
ncbi:unnamed protein product [Ectocarpus sp. 4 AP-2014]